MEFPFSSERFELMDLPRPSRLGREPPADGNEENSDFVEFDQEEHYTPTGSNIFEMEEGIPGNESQQIRQFTPSHTADEKRLDQVNKVKIGKRRLPQSKILKHSDARLPEVTRTLYI